MVDLGQAQYMLGITIEYARDRDRDRKQIHLRSHVYKVLQILNVQNCRL